MTAPSASCTSTILTSTITAILTAFLATGIFVLVQIAVCKCHLKFTPGGTESGQAVYEQMGGGERGVAMSDKCHYQFTPGRTESATLAEGKGEATYEQIERGVAVSDPTYMAIGDGTTVEAEKSVYTVPAY